MSGYLEVKYPFKSNLGLNPFKSWKRQWCILRPSPTCSGGSLAVYCSEAGAAVGSVELPAGCVVKRAKSRTRPYAFAVFPVDDGKPRALLAAQSLHEAQSWMEKIRALLNGDKLLGMETLIKDSYSVTVVPTEFSHKCGVNGDSIVTMASNGILFNRAQKLGMFLEWKHITDIVMCTEDKNRTCIVTVDSEFSGGGSLRLVSPLARALGAALQRARPPRASAAPRARRPPHPLSRSDSDLRADSQLEDRRSSWYSGPSEVSLDDIDLVMAKESGRVPIGQLSRCSGAPDLAPRPRLASAPPDTPHAAHTATRDTHSAARDTRNDTRDTRSDTRDTCNDTRDTRNDTRDTRSDAHDTHNDTRDTRSDAHDTHSARITHTQLVSHVADDSMSDRRSLLSIASGIYEEIPDLPEQADTPDTYCAMGRDETDSVPEWPEPVLGLEEPTYESVSDCVYATMRRTGKRYPPPPLPPRVPFGTSKLSWANCGCGSRAVTRHGSLGSLPACCRRREPRPHSPPHCRSFSVFRKRLKSDSRLLASPKSDAAKENKGAETKKKRFEFAPPRDIFKSFKVGRKGKGLKAAPGALAKGETKSCEFLDETEHVTTSRCSKSAECLEDEFLNEFDGDLSIEFNDEAVAALALPQEIVDLILRGREQFSKIRLKEQIESEYMPMTPLVPPAPIEHHYIVMSPKTNIASTN